VSQARSDSVDEARAAVATSPPHSKAIRVAAGASLLLAGLLNGLPQVIAYLLGQPYGSRLSDTVRWAAENSAVVPPLQYALVASMLFATVGLLGVAQVCRWRAPTLTLIGTPLAVWGMWGFHNILMLGLLLTTFAPRALGVEETSRLADGLQTDPAGLFLALGPHLIGSFLGVLLLSIAWIRSGFPRGAGILVLAFLLWDFALAPAGLRLGPLEPHMLLILGWGWMGLYIMRMPDAVWRGGRPLPGRVPESSGGSEEG
jgi:hypothetical protein